MFDIFDGSRSNPYWTIPIYKGKMNAKLRRYIANAENYNTFVNIASTLILNAMDMRYDIKGVPETMSKRVIKQGLLWYGNICFFNTDGIWAALPVTPGGNFNANGDPGSGWVVAKNGSFSKNIELYLPGGDDSVFLRKLTLGSKQEGKPQGIVLWENELRIPFIRQVIWFAEKIADTYRTMDLARVSIKNPIIATARGKAVADEIERALQERRENVDTIINIGDKDINDSIDFLQIEDKSNSIIAATATIEWYEAKYRELIGVRNNSQINKKGENLINAEISVNDEYTYMAVNQCIDYMNEQLDGYINRFTGLDMHIVEVDRTNENILGSVDKVPARDKGGESNEMDR